MSLSNSDNVKRKVRVEISSQLIDGRYLNAADSNFLEIVLEDVQSFQEKGIQSSVLVFPPFNNYHRFLIHKLVEDNFEDLSTFSVGHSFGRRTVVCYKEQLLRQENLTKRTCVPTAVSMGVQQQSNSEEDQDPKVIIACSERKKVRTLPDVAIYRPPALRKADEGPSSSSLQERKPKASKQRRPDIAVYIPRALRGTQKASAAHKSSPTASGLILKSISPGESEGTGEEKILSPQPSKANVSKKVNHTCIQKAPQKLSYDESSPSSTAPNSQSNIPKDPLLPSTLSLDSLPDEKVMHDSPSTKPSSSPSSSRVEFPFICKTGIRKNECPEIDSLSIISSEQSEKQPLSFTMTQDVTGTNEEKDFCAGRLEGDDARLEHICSEEMAKSATPEKQFLGAKQICFGVDDSVVEGSHFENLVQGKDNTMGLTTSSPKKNLEISEESSVINLRKTNALRNEEVTIKAKGENGVNIPKDIDGKREMIPEIGCVGTKNLDNSESGRTGVCENDSEGDIVPLSSWEELFDLPEDGIEVAKAEDNRSHKLMEEVVTAVGRVNVVEKARCNYTQYRTDNAHALAELSHVVEVYGFPAEFKTQDLISVLSSYGGGNSCAPAFEIKWVDDTHALAVFASSFVAADVLNLHHPMVKTRSLEEASAVSKAKARKTCESLRIPFRPRPETCAALAQRLITGALGVHHRQSKAEREEERRLLREAREKRRNAAKERDAAWEGTIGSSM